MGGRVRVLVVLTGFPDDVDDDANAGFVFKCSNYLATGVIEL